MEKIKNIEEIQSFITYIKEKNQGYITNFYISNERIAVLLKAECLFYTKYENTVFILMEINDYIKLYYFSINYSTLSNDLLNLDSLDFKNIILICDIMGKGELLEEKEVFKKHGYKEYGSLIHFTKQMKGLESPLIMPENIKYAILDDYKDIVDIIHKQFNKYIDINFIGEEIKNYISKQQAIKIVDDKDNLAGFCIYDYKNKKAYGIIGAIKNEYRGTLYGYNMFNYTGQLYDRYKLFSCFVRDDNEYLLKYYRKLKYIEDGLKIFIYYKEYGKKIEDIIPMN